MTPTLETSLVEWKQEAGHSRNVEARFLGNFLSGMETFHRGPGLDNLVNLGNFLSGMETKSSAPDNTVGF